MNMFLSTTGVVIALVVTVLIALFLRRVVAPNEVHIVQSSKHTKSYGKDTPNGNSYYSWPSWIPFIGVTVTTLPVSIFDVSLKNYEAYDTGRVPFLVDVVGFFRIQDTNAAAQRVQNFTDLEAQLLVIAQGAIRTTLASHDIDTIMTQRATFGEQFTKEIEEQLKEWGVVPVKNLELMDIRDSSDNKVIHNIMSKKKSLIEAQSRSEVAKNMQDAQIAEVNAQRQIDLQKQEALETVGLRTADKDQKVGIAQQQADQAVMEQHRLTKEKEMAVTRVAQTQQAEIDRDVHVTNADQAKQVAILGAEGALEAKKREAEGIQVAGIAKAEAEKALQLAPVQAQITLAKEIGENVGYQNYLITIRKVEADQAVGTAQAEALRNADVKVIANTGGSAASGLDSVRDLVSSKGGLAVGSMLESLANTEQGKALLNLVTPKGKAA